jgi:hypothetical protein
MKTGIVKRFAIVYVQPPYPTSLGEIVGENEDSFRIQFPWGKDLWDKRHVKVFESLDVAQKEYDDFKHNPNNYAYEG